MKCVLKSISIAALLCALSATGSQGSTLGKSYLLFGLNEYGYAYAEDDGFDPPEIGTPKSDEYGMTSAFHLEGKFFSHDPKTPWYGGFLYEYGGGIQTYNGSPLDSFEIDPTSGDTIHLFPSLIDTKSNTFTRIGGFVGPFFDIGSSLVGLNAGLLYYRWYRGTGSESETYSWVYLPIGADISWKLDDQWSLGVDLQYRLMLSGSMQVGLDDYIINGISASVPAITLGTRDGFYIGVPLQVQVTRQFGIEFKPWYEYRPSGMSGPVVEQVGLNNTEIYEPSSNSYSIGMSISAMFGNFASYSQAR